MFTTEVLADNSIAADVPGNKLTIDAELVGSENLANPNSDHQIALTLTFNTAHDDEPDTEVFVQIPLDKAGALADAIKGMITAAADEKFETLLKVMEFRTAQLACAKGQVGQLRITKIGDSDRGDTVGFGYYNLEYLDDQPDDMVLHSVENIECYVPFAEADQFEWLRTLVGGNHQYTTSIKVNLVDFTFAEIAEEFNAHMATRLQESKG